jgi:hypothetical protein
MSVGQLFGGHMPKWYPCNSFRSVTPSVTMYNAVKRKINFEDEGEIMKEPHSATRT